MSKSEENDDPKVKADVKVKEMKDFKVKSSVKTDDPKDFKEILNLSNNKMLMPEGKIDFV